MTRSSGPTTAGSDVRVELDGSVGIVEIRRGPHNYFDTDLIRDLVAALETLSREARVAVLCSEGKHFCAGARLQSADENADGPSLYVEALRLFDQPLPLVAAVQGGAIGGGLGLAMVADFRVASTDAWFTANFSRLGLHHGFALTVTLPAAIGQQAALDLLYTGRRIGAETALAMRLCDSVVDPGELRAAAVKLAGEIAAAAPLAVQAIRATMRRHVRVAARSAVEHELAEQRKLLRTADFAEGVQAASERREPAFQGR